MLYRHFGLMALGTADGVQRDGLAVGAEAPALTGVLSDGTATEWSPKSRLSTLLFFAAPDCEPCARMAPYLNELARRDDLRVVAMASGSRQTAERMTEKFSPIFTSLADDGSGAFQEYRVRVTPFAFVVGEDGRIRAKGLSSDPYRLRDLLQQGGSEAASRSVRFPGENLRLRFDLSSWWLPLMGKPWTVRLVTQRLMTPCALRNWALVHGRDDLDMVERSAEWVARTFDRRTFMKRSAIGLFGLASAGAARLTFPTQADAAACKYFDSGCTWQSPRWRVLHQLPRNVLQWRQLRRRLHLRHSVLADRMLVHGDLLLRRRVLHRVLSMLRLQLPRPHLRL